LGGGLSLGFENSLFFSVFLRKQILAFATLVSLNHYSSSAKDENLATHVVIGQALKSLRASTTTVNGTVKNKLLLLKSEFKFVVPALAGIEPWESSASHSA